MGCCGPSNTKCWRIVSLVGVVLLIGFSAFLFTSFKDFSDTIRCIISGYVVLMANPTVGADINLLPTEFIQNSDKYLPYFEIAAITPSVIAAVMSIIVVLCTCRSGKCCAKFFIWLTCFLLLVCFIFYAIIGAAGVVSETEQAKTLQTEITNVCADVSNIGDLNTAIVQAQVDLNTAQSNGANVAQAQAELDAAQLAVTTYTTMCTCLVGIMDDVKKLAVPGILNALACLIDFIALIGLCCTMGCCRSPSKTYPSA